MLNKQPVFALLIALHIACKTPVSTHKPPITTRNADTAFFIPAHPLRNENDLNILIEAIGDSRVVLLGESTHGTHEFYTWRTALSKRLIQEKGFDFIAIEGDWVESYKVNQFIRGAMKDSNQVIELLKEYNRWPSSLWRNYETASLVYWLNTYNQRKIATEQVGFYGLDVYGFWKWTGLPVAIKDTIVQQAIQQMRNCFEDYGNDALKYAEIVRRLNTNCKNETELVWKTVEALNSKQYSTEEIFVLRQQALLALHGEKYFRNLVSNRTQSWNIRDGYMALTVQRLLNHHGKNAKAIVWAHNSHAGDVQYSNMASTGHISVGQLLRKELGRNKIFIVGFGTYTGGVIGGRVWGAALQEFPVPPARIDSWEYMLRRQSATDKIILSRDIKEYAALKQMIPFRSIGAVAPNVVYGYAIIPQRFDAFIFIDSSTAIRPIVK